MSEGSGRSSFLPYKSDIRPTFRCVVVDFEASAADTVLGRSFADVVDVVVLVIAGRETSQERGGKESNNEINHKDANHRIQDGALLTTPAGDGTGSFLKLITS